MLSSPFHIHSILKLAPVLSQKSRKMHLARTFCSSAAKTSTVTPIFYFMILIRTVHPVNEKIKLAYIYIYVQVFGNFTNLYGLSYNGRIARALIKSTLERQVEGIKRHFF